MTIVTSCGHVTMEELHSYHATRLTQLNSRKINEPVQISRLNRTPCNRRAATAAVVLSE